MLAFLLQQSSCYKNCLNTTYQFELPVKAYPNIDSINIGDTLWFEINESVILKNSDGNMVDYSGAENLGTVIDVQKIDSINKLFVESVNNFDYKVERGKEIMRTNLYVEYAFSELNNRFFFKVAFIPKEKGIFRIGVGSSNNTFREGDKCSKAKFTINFKETNSHDYYIRLVNPNAPVNVLVTNNYFFKVK